jgi:uncharacterized integral membrane protein
MRGRLILLTVLLIVGALIAALNWEVMGSTVRLQLIAGVAQAPVGLLVLAAFLLPVLLLLLAGMLDQARTLRQVETLERRLEEARAAAQRARSAELETLERSLQERFETLRAALEGVVQGTESRLEARLEVVEAGLGGRLEDLRDRVVLVRDELAADIAEAEDALLRGRPGATAPPAEPDDE